MIAFKGNGRFDFQVVGERSYQENILLAAGSPGDTGHDIMCLAALVTDDNNPYDNQAVAVGVVRRQQLALLVGYLPRKAARDFRKEVVKLSVDQCGHWFCRAMIVGGHLLTPTTRAYFGVNLDLRIPLRLYSSTDHLSGLII